MSYTPNPDRTVEERILAYLNTTGEVHRAFEIADAIDSKPEYTRRVCNQLYEDDQIQKFWGTPVIGHPMPDGDTRVLVNNRKALLEIVENYRPDLLAEAKSKPTIEKLREFIKEKITVGQGHPLGNQKVSYSIDTEPDADSSAGGAAASAD